MNFGQTTFVQQRARCRLPVSIEILVLAELLRQGDATLSHLLHHLLVCVRRPFVDLQLLDDLAPFGPILDVVQWPRVHGSVPLVRHLVERLFVHPADVKLKPKTFIETTESQSEYSSTHFGVGEDFLGQAQVRAKVALLVCVEERGQGNAFHLDQLDDRLQLGHDEGAALQNRQLGHLPARRHELRIRTGLHLVLKATHLQIDR